MMEPKFHSTSGRKYVNKNGISAIKDGVKRSKHIELVDITKGRKPRWLKAKIPNGKRFLKVIRFGFNQKFPELIISYGISLMFFGTYSIPLIAGIKN